MKYRRYDPKVKFLISKSKNPYLFPELDIPVSTAKEWIKQKVHLSYTSKDESHEVALLKKQIEELKRENYELRKRFFILKKVIEIMGLRPSERKISSREIKKKVVEVIQKHKSRNSLRTILGDISFTLSRYKRWKREIQKPERILPETYIQNNIRSLTFKEIKTLIHLYTSKVYGHYPLYSLTLKARRLNLLHCSPRTWRKYAKLFNLTRPFNTPIKKSYYPIGINARYPNELWHIDVTEVRVKRKKVYIQVILDNHSRYVLNWEIQHQWSAKKTLGLIKKTVNQYGNPLGIMADAGRENINKNIFSYLRSNDIEYLISKQNTYFSNSKVEVFFRSMKSNYLSKVKIKSRSKLERELMFYVNEYNTQIPHSALNGRTPEEVINYMPENFYIDTFKVHSIEAVKKRINNFKIGKE